MRLFFGVLLLMIVQPTARACSCAGGGGPACYEAWTQYTSAVFLGKVSRITGIRNRSGAEIITLGEGTKVNSINLKLLKEDLLPESEQ